MQIFQSKIFKKKKLYLPIAAPTILIGIALQFIANSCGDYHLPSFLIDGKGEVILFIVLNKFNGHDDNR